MSSDDLLRQAWVGLKHELDITMPVESAPVELEEVDLPDVDDRESRPSSSSPVDSFVRTKRPATE
jgi:hypothetical protein